MNGFVELNQGRPEKRGTLFLPISGERRTNAPSAELPAEQLPLFPPLPPGESYPVDALGPVLSRAVVAITSKVQVPSAIAAQSVLATASLAAQAHADVVMPYGQTRPLSLFFATVAGSGDRKSTADNEALWPVRKHERYLKEEHDRLYQDWVISSAAWGAEKRKIEGDRKLDFPTRKLALGALGPESPPPLFPLLTAPDPTVEGLAKAWVNALGSLGLFTAEGGQFVGGHGMSAENRLKSSAIFSEIWDGKPIKRVRAQDGVSLLHGRRLALHLMIQPDAAALFLADPVLRDQGLLSRVLVAAPDSIAGTRHYREPAPQDDAAIRAYGNRILSLLETPWPLSEGSRNELEPRALAMSGEATGLWRAFYDHVEAQCGAQGELRGIRDFAAKAAEHAARIAGVLTIVDDVHAPEIGAEAMQSALTLTDWYVAEAVRLQQAARTDPKLLRAAGLLDWLRSRNTVETEFRDILRLGPAATRTKDAADAAVATLKVHGLVVEIMGRPRVVRILPGERH